MSAKVNKSGLSETQRKMAEMLADPESEHRTISEICEAVGIISTLLYIGLQIYCGILYGAGVFIIFTQIKKNILCKYFYFQYQSYS